MPDNNNSIFPAVVGGLAGSVGNGLVSMFTGRSNAQMQADIAFDNWKKQFDLVNEYNKPINQLKRYSQVGVNPFVNPSGSQMVGMSSSSASPSGAMPTFAPVDGFGNTFSQLMSGLLSAFQAKGKSVENSRLGEFLDAQIRNQLSQAGLNDVQAAYQHLANEIYEKYGNSVEHAKLRNLLQDIAVKQSDLLLKQSQAGYYDQSAMESLAKEAHERALAVLGQKEIDVFDSRFNKWLDLASSQIKANIAGASDSSASARLKGAQTETENLLRKERHTELVIENGLRGLQFANEEEFSHEDRRVALQSSIEQAEILSKENNVFYWRFAVDVLKAVADGVISATFASKLLRFGKAGKDAKTAEEFNKKAHKVGDIMEHVEPPSEKGSGAPVFPRDKDKYPNLYKIWSSGKSGVR